MNGVIRQFVLIVAIILLGLLAALVVTLLTAFLHADVASAIPALTFVQSLVAVLVVWLVVTIL